MHAYAGFEIEAVELWVYVIGFEIEAVKLRVHVVVGFEIEAVKLRVHVGTTCIESLYRSHSTA